MMPEESITIRPARPADGAPVFTWTQNTFSWGDYISEVWDRWVKPHDGQLLVAEAEGRVVGTLHVAFLGNHEGWMEGMRVHPDFRKRGIATRLDLAGQKIARAQGCRLVRLETSSINLPAQSAIVTYGYRRIGNTQEWDAPALEGQVEHIRLATARDARALMELWQRSWMRRAAHGIAPMREGWRWGELTRARLNDYVAHDCVWMTPAQGQPNGMAIIRTDADYISVRIVVGRAPALGLLLSDLRVRAYRSGFDKLYLHLPVSPRAAAWAQANGFSAEDHTMFIYECTLK